MSTHKEVQIWRTDKENLFLRDGQPVIPPEGWVFVPSGDPGLPRRLKTLGECWVVVHRRKNRIEATGLWTDGRMAEFAAKRLKEERSSPEYRRKLEAARKRREAEQNAYVARFRKAVLDFLAFAPRYADPARRLADAVTDQAVPVGSGTVARTERIPLEQRAEAAVIAWMRHQTTGYDFMTIARIKGERRQVRRMLAERSRELLDRYRKGLEPAADCPLAKALGVRFS